MLHVRINVPPVPEALEALADGLVQLDEFYLRHALSRGLEMPPLYESGIVYRREPKGREWWESAADLHSLVTQRSGDCEDLAALRSAELRVFEDDYARVKVVRTSRGTFHAIVEHEDGELEDPSRILVILERRRDRRKGTRR
jgi:hypothetical protein